MKKYIPQSMRQTVKKIFYPVPSHLSDKFIQIDAAKLHLIEQSLRENYFTGWRGEGNYSEEKFKEDLDSHLSIRLNGDRRQIVPWLNNAMALEGKHILEIGCGTGSSTIALAEQGATVVGVDIDEGALRAAETRATVYGVEATFEKLNAEQITSHFQTNQFDIIIYFACLEHMTVAERMPSLKASWEMLPPDGLLVVVETPNRLWYFDNHTAYLPFYHWLTDELAFTYSQFSERGNFRDLYKEYTAESKEHFLRRGRGMSFHEFDLAIGRAENLNVVSSLSTFEGIRFALKQSRLDRQYKSMLKRIYPKIHEGFFDDFLHLIIKKEHQSQVKQIGCLSREK